MRNILLILFALFSITALPMMAQMNNEPQMKKEASKARVTILQGQDHLVLVTGRKANSYNPNIEISQGNLKEKMLAYVDSITEYMRPSIDEELQDMGHVKTNQC